MEDPADFVTSMRRGLREGYPFCCVLAFAADAGVPASFRIRGLAPEGYVPCWEHAGGP